MTCKNPNKLLNLLDKGGVLYIGNDSCVVHYDEQEVEFDIGLWTLVGVLMNKSGYKWELG